MQEVDARTAPAVHRDRTAYARCALEMPRASRVAASVCFGSRASEPHLGGQTCSSPRGEPYAPEEQLRHVNIQRNTLSRHLRALWWRTVGDAKPEEPQGCPDVLRVPATSSEVSQLAAVTAGWTTSSSGSGPQGPGLPVAKVGPRAQTHSRSLISSQCRVGATSHSTWMSTTGSPMASVGVSATLQPCPRLTRCAAREPTTGPVERKSPREYRARSSGNAGASNGLGGGASPRGRGWFRVCANVFAGHGDTRTARGNEAR